MAWWIACLALLGTVWSGRADRTPAWLEKGDEVEKTVSSPGRSMAAYEIAGEAGVEWIEVRDMKSGGGEKIQPPADESFLALVQGKFPKFNIHKFKVFGGGIESRLDSVAWLKSELIVTYRVRLETFYPDFDGADVRLIYHYECKPGPTVKILGDPAVDLVPQKDEGFSETRYPK